ncbi:MAG: rRNA maturation RNase YbeY [Deltaproteobacteria bacterium]|jgi:probable rRNA maturation factor|nr:rRNA maturation RNase YbeY [Deltaproteobacteria bacterium]
MVILIKNIPKESLINDLKLKRRLAKVLRALGRHNATITVLLTNDLEMRDLNRSFRGLDKSTNVLAFPANEEVGGPKSPPLPAPFRNFLGDIAVSLETVTREATEIHRGDVGELLYFYLIHGILHLVGYDHERGAADAKAQDEETWRLMDLIPHSLG